MADLFNGVIKLTEEQYKILEEKGTLTVGDITLVYDNNSIYITDEIDYYTKSESDNKFATNENLQNYATKNELPKKTSELENDSGFITEESIPEVDLSNYYKKSETYSKSEIDGLFIGESGDNLLKISPFIMEGGTVDSGDEVGQYYPTDSNGNNYSLGLKVGTEYTLTFEIDGVVSNIPVVAMDGSGYVEGSVIIAVENMSSADYSDISLMILDMPSSNMTMIVVSRPVAQPFDIPTITLMSISGLGTKYYTKTETQQYVQEQIANAITEVLNTEV